MDRSISWSVRCQHESQCWENNAFLTLTYDDEHLPWDGSLSGEEPRLFIRYLRRHLTGVQLAPPECPFNGGRSPIRYFGCGEYGTKRGRAHYHLLLFNVRFTDTTPVGKATYTSSLVSRLWKHGSHLIGTVNPGSASYVAGYALKKVSKWEREQKYGVMDPETGEFRVRKPEFAMMSLKPPIGSYWFARYKSELRNGFVVVNGKETPIPRLYRDKLKLSDPSLFDEMQFNRHQKMASFDPADRTPQRLAVRERVLKAKKAFHKRDHMED